jgi:hypothetical protein
MVNRFVLLLVLLTSSAALAAEVAHAVVKPLSEAHSHNDYLHRRPLLDALDQGFCGVEADVFLVDGDLLVAHDRKDVKPGFTLRSAYLEPLAQRVRGKIGIFATPGTRLQLLVDVKKDGAAVYEVLKRQLEPYSDILTRFGPTGISTGAVTVVISGDRAVERIAADAERLCAVDGRLAQLEDGSSAALYPLMSESWPFRWRGEGAMPSADREKLAAIVSKAHAQGRKVRFWGGPDRLSAWEEMKRAGVDLINTDRLPELGAFLRGEPQPAAKVVEETQ